MSNQMAFLLFGDQSVETHGCLSDFCKSGPSLLAKHFLTIVGTALQNEIDSLSAAQRQRFPSFRTIQQLNQRYHESGVKNLAIDSALLVATQLAHYIDRSEKFPEDDTRASDTCVVGLCTGLLSAAAVTLAPSLTSLIPFAVHMVLIAFRTGLYVSEVGGSLHNSEGSKCWTYVVPNASETSIRAILKEYNTIQNLPITSYAYVSAIAPNSVAISGPPSTLANLLATIDFGSKPIQLPVHGPYHAAHLHSGFNASQLLGLDGSATGRLIKASTVKSTILSCSTGLPYEAKDTEALLANIVRDILINTLNLQALLQGCVKRASSFIGKTCLIIPLGTTSASKALASLLETETGLRVAIRKPGFSESNHLPSHAGDHGSSINGKLAIVGMAGRFPDAASHEKLWELLGKGLDVHRVVPADRFDYKTHVQEDGKGINKSHTPFGCWIENPGLFDPRFFNMSPREAYQTCPMQRLALSTCYEALEMSGYVPDRTRSTKLDRIGTFYGQTSDDWREINAAQDVDTYFITGGVRAFGPGRINYHFGFSGPSFSVDTACSSSMAAMQLACTSLWAKDCDTALVGGMSCMTNSDIFSGLSKGQFLSKTGQCKTWDNDADGYCRADGVGTVVVKRYEDAVADNDNILAVILGTATNHSADAISITHPHGKTQEHLYNDILDMAGVDPLDVDYVEMHGTGTQAGDGTEMLSVTNVFAPAHRKRSAAQPLWLGAIKANVGHGEAASGVTALVKCLMMLQKNEIPPHVGIKGQINQGFPTDLAERNVNIPFHKTPFFGRAGQPRTIYISNFSAAGGNSGLLIQDAPHLARQTQDPRPVHIVAVSAKSKSAMLRNIERLVDYLDLNPTTLLADLAYTSTARRIQHNWRAVVTGPELSKIKSELKLQLSASFTPIAQAEPKIAFLFTGQGSHYAALGKSLYETSTTFRTTIRVYNDIALLHGFASFLPLIDGSVADVQTLSPVVVQLGLVCFEMAMFRLWTSWGVNPSVVVGHSLGEYAALYAAGVLSASDTIYLVGSRATLLVERCTAGTHAMLAIKGDVASVTATLERAGMFLNVACINGPGETVVSGETIEIESAAHVLNDAAFKCTALKVPYAFHSAQVDKILEDFEDLSSKVTFNSSSIPVISPLLGRVMSTLETVDQTYLSQHARKPVDFLGALRSAHDNNIVDDKTIWLEVGPHPVCIGMVKSTFGLATFSAPSLKRSEEPYVTISNSLATLYTSGISIDWNEYHREFVPSLRMLDLPSYSFDDKNYWLQYTGDWLLTKNPANQVAQKAIEPAMPTLSTTSVHKVVEESFQKDTATVIIETDIAKPGIRAAIAGHNCNGSPLCPSSIYADMAMTVCDYAYKQLRPSATAPTGLNVQHMEVTKPLILKLDAASQCLRMSTEIDLVQGKASVKFYTEVPKQHHATCTVIFGDNEQFLQEWYRNAYLIQSRIDCLKAAEVTGKADKIGRGLAYKLFAAFVDYDPRYRGMEEVILGADMEATAKVNFQTSASDGDFFASPYWIDSCCHISGFIVNGTDATDSRNEVYVSHGWESFRIAEPFQREKTYRSYVRMQPTGDKKMVSGDVFVFDGDRIVAMVGGLKFQCIPRTLLNMFLPPQKAAGKLAAKSPPAKVIAAPVASAPRAGNMKSVASAQVTAKNLSAINKKLVSVTSQAFDILAKEIGVSIDELVDNIAFTDLGVDSLMTLTVAGRMREELELEIESHVFNDHPTCGEFREYMSVFEQPAVQAATTHDSSSSEEDSMDDATPDSGETSPISTPSECSDSEIEKPAVGGLSVLIKTTIAEEMGISIDEIADHSDLSTMGMDSLMSLTILGSLRETTGMDLPADLFAENTTILEIEKALGVRKAPPPPAPKPVKAAVVVKQEAVSAAPIQKAIIVVDRQANSVLLQGKPRSAEKHLWIVPDGSGSATSYTEIPNLLPNLAVWGLNSPYMKTPEEFNNGVKGIATKYIEEMKRRQPTGPYLLAGWSAGGVIAFEITVQLIAAGDKVEHLLLLDTPCPLTIEPLPSSLHRWFASIGVLGAPSSTTAPASSTPPKIPSWLLPHFASSVTALSEYTATPISHTHCPLVTIVWCEDGVCKYPEDPRPEPYPYGHAQWLLENRTDFGPNLWDTYIPGEKLVMKTMGGHHFSMMKGKEAKVLGDLMREGLLRTE